MMNYTIFDPMVEKPLHLCSRSEAKQAYSVFIESKKSRLEELKCLVESSSSIVLDDSELSLEELYEWFISLCVHERKLEYEHPSPEVFSICNDIAIYISEMLIKETKTLKWKFYTTAKTNVSYQRPVITGFNAARGYTEDFDLNLCRIAYQILEGREPNENRFLKMYQYALSLA